MKEKQTKKFFNLVKFFLFLIVVLALVQIYVSHRLATAGKRVAELENTALAISEKNQQLREEISCLGSLAVVSEKARHLGFKTTSEIVYLTPKVPVALNY